MKYGAIDVSNLKVGELSVVAVEHSETSYVRWIQEPGKPRYRGIKPIKRWYLVLACRSADRQRANAFADMLQIMADEQRQILSENASLRRKLEKMERKPER